VTAVAGVTFSGAVATVTATSVVDLSSTIDWGDGHTSAGTFSPQSTASFAISGSNTYTAVGSYFLHITVASTDGSTQAVATTATVTAPPGCVNADIAMISSVQVSMGSSSCSGLVLSAWDGHALGAGVPMVVLNQPAAGQLALPPQPPAPPPPPPVQVPLVSFIPAGSPGTVASTEQVAWAPLKEQLSSPPSPSPSPPAPAPVLARQVVPPAEPSRLLVLFVPDHEAEPENPHGTLVQALARTAESAPDNQAWSAALPGQRGALPLSPEELRGFAAPAPVPPADAGPNVYHRPLHQVADRSELSVVPSILPPRPSQPESGIRNAVAPALLPPLSLERGRREAEGASDTLVLPESPAPRAAREPSEADGSLLPRRIRRWLLAVAACVLQALHFRFFGPFRRPAPSLNNKQPAGKIA
jgi:hypothetical protein